MGENDTQIRMAIENVTEVQMQDRERRVIMRRMQLRSQGRDNCIGQAALVHRELSISISTSASFPSF
jgi:hypothetical protein